MKEVGSRGSLIRSDQAAFVVDADGSVSLLLPSLEADAPIGPGHRLLLAIASRLNDPEWVEDLLYGGPGSGGAPGRLM